MCTVVIGFDPAAAWPVVLLGLRDEEASRAWDPPGPWWPHLGDGIVGVHDREAGGAWLAVNESTSRASVVLNRHEPVPVPFGGYVSRGVLPLESVTTGAQELRDPDADLPTTRAFNLVDLAPDSVSFTRWDGARVERHDLGPGVHMITHEGPDVPSVAREHRWLPEFRAAARPDGPAAEPTWEPWLDVLRASAVLAPTDDEALFRRDEAEGHVYESLSVTALAVRPGEASLRHARLASPGHLAETLAWR